MMKTDTEKQRGARREGNSIENDEKQKAEDSTSNDTNSCASLAAPSTLLTKESAVFFSPQ
jgi:hypothetical protein